MTQAEGIITHKTILVDGTTITLGGRPFVLPPFNFRLLKKYMPVINGFTTNDMDVERVDAIVEMVHAALLRNYPGFSREFVEENMDLRNMPVIFAALMNQSGLTEGEARPVAETTAE